MRGMSRRQSWRPEGKRGSGWSLEDGRKTQEGTKVASSQPLQSAAWRGGRQVRGPSPQT